jgi:hypothetical protein
MKIPFAYFCANSFCASRASSLLLAIACAGSLMAGCASLVPVTPTVTNTAVPKVVKTEPSPLDYYAWAKTASETELQMEQYGLDLTIAAPDPVINAVRKSIILSVSPLANAKTQSQAALLLEKVPQLDALDDTSQAYKIFGSILLAIQQQRKDMQATEAVNQRALIEIDTLKSRNAELQQQIEELTSIERQIIERERLAPEP